MSRIIISFSNNCTRIDHKRPWNMFGDFQSVCQDIMRVTGRELYWIAFGIYRPWWWHPEKKSTRGIFEGQHTVRKRYVCIRFNRPAYRWIRSRGERYYFFNPLFRGFYFARFTSPVPCRTVFYVVFISFKTDTLAFFIRIITVDIRSRIHRVCELIQSISHTVSDPTEVWNGTNRSGENAPSGAYIYMLDSPYGKLSGKLMIIRWEGHE